MLKIKNSIIYISVAILLTGCSEYLSELPDNRTIIDSPEKVSSLITGAYPESTYMLFTELMSDNADDKRVLSLTQPLELSMYTWEDTNLEGRNTPAHYWNNTYEAISQANQALASIKELPNLELSAQKGEALIARAYAHFMLVNLWGKAYDPATAASDLGIPYVTEPETVLIKKYTRNTVKEVYEFIEKDLTEGLSLVKNDYKEPKFHFTKEASYAFAARFFLYKGDWDKVVFYASKAIDAGGSIRNLLEYDALSYTEQRIRYSSASESTNLLVSYVSSTWRRRYARSRFGLTDDIGNELFRNSSGNPFGKNWLYDIYGSDNTRNLPRFNEYFRYTNESAGIGLPFTGVVLFDRDELFLNRAEAYAMLNNYASALQDITVFLASKTANFDSATDILTESMITSQYPVEADEYTPYYSMSDEQTSFVKAIAELRRREYYHEGLRWFDIKRFNLKVEHNLVGEPDPIELEKRDLKKQLQIPQFVVSQGVEANPR